MCYVQLWVHICIASKAVYIYVNLFETIVSRTLDKCLQIIMWIWKKPVMENFTVCHPKIIWVVVNKHVYYKETVEINNIAYMVN